MTTKTKNLYMIIISILFLILLLSLKLLTGTFILSKIEIPQILLSSDTFKSIFFTKNLSIDFISNIDLFLSSSLYKSIAYCVISIISSAYLFNFVKLLTNNSTTAKISIVLFLLNSLNFLAGSISLANNLAVLSIITLLHNFEFSRKNNAANFNHHIVIFLVSLIGVLSDYVVLFIIPFLLFINTDIFKKNVFSVAGAYLVFLILIIIKFSLFKSQIDFYIQGLDFSLLLTNLKYILSTTLIFLSIFAFLITKNEYYGLETKKIITLSIIISILFLMVLFSNNKILMITNLSYLIILIIPYISLVISKIFNQDFMSKIAVIIYFVFVTAFSAYSIFNFINFLNNTVVK